MYRLADDTVESLYYQRNKEKQLGLHFGKIISHMSQIQADMQALSRPDRQELRKQRVDMVQREHKHLISFRIKDIHNTFAVHQKVLAAEHNALADPRRSGGEHDNCRIIAVESLIEAGCPALFDDLPAFCGVIFQLIKGIKRNARR